MSDDGVEELEAQEIAADEASHRDDMIEAAIHAIRERAATASDEERAFLRRLAEILGVPASAADAWGRR